MRKESYLIVGGGPPTNPEKEERAIRAAAKIMLKAPRKSAGVIVHCTGGRGR